MEVPEYLWHWSRESEIIFVFYTLEMLKVCRWRFLSIFGSGKVTQKLKGLIDFRSLTWFDVMSEERPELSGK